jgi:HAD superfamily hydrolase (TIGR01450 family)
MRLNLLIDLSGTLHIGDQACPGAIAALKQLFSSKPVKEKCSDIKVRFCSNTTKESKEDLQKRLVRIGFDEEIVTTNRIMTSLQACTQLCVKQQWNPLLILTPSAQNSFRDLLANGSKSDTKNSIQHAFFPDPNSPPSKLSSKEKEDLKKCDSVIVGLAPNLFNSEWLDEAFRILSNEYQEGQKHLVATHRALYFRPGTDEPLSMGPGAYIAALEAATRRSPDQTIVCGKPSKTFLQMCIDDIREERQANGLGEDSEQTIIIGDDIEADLGGGSIELGLDRMLGK